MVGKNRVDDPNMDLHLTQGQYLSVENRDFSTMKSPETTPVSGGTAQ